MDTQLLTIRTDWNVCFCRRTFTTLLFPQASWKSGRWCCTAPLCTRTRLCAAISPDPQTCCHPPMRSSQRSTSVSDKSRALLRQVSHSSSHDIMKSLATDFVTKTVSCTAVLAIRVLLKDVIRFLDNETYSYGTPLHCYTVCLQAPVTLNAMKMAVKVPDLITALTASTTSSSSRTIPGQSDFIASTLTLFLHCCCQSITNMVTYFFN